MIQAIRAIYENGVFRPLDAPNVAEHEQVRLTVESMASSDENANASELAENVAAVEASIDDFNRGERGTPAGEHSRQLRQALGLANE